MVPVIRPQVRDRVSAGHRPSTLARAPVGRGTPVPGTPRDLTGKVVVITGAARGIGAATARALAREGARLAIGDLDGDLAASVATELGGEAIGRKLDVTDHAGFAAFLDEVEDTLGP